MTYFLNTRPIKTFNMKIKLHKNPARKNNVFYKNNEEVHCERQIGHMSL